MNPSYDYIISPSSIGLGTLDEPYRTPEPEKEESSDSQVSVASPLEYRDPEPIASRSEQAPGPDNSPITCSSEEQTPVIQKGTREWHEAEEVTQKVRFLTLGPADMSGTATTATTITGTQQAMTGSAQQGTGGQSGQPVHRPPSGGGGAPGGGAGPPGGGGGPPGGGGAPPLQQQQQQPPQQPAGGQASTGALRG